MPEPGAESAHASRGSPPTKLCVPRTLQAACGTTPGPEGADERQTPSTEPSCLPLQKPENKATPWASPPGQSGSRRCPTWWWETVFSSRSGRRRRKPHSRTSACACGTERCVRPPREGWEAGPSAPEGEDAATRICGSLRDTERRRKKRARASVPDRGEGRGSRPRVSTAPTHLSRTKAPCVGRAAAGRASPASVGSEPKLPPAGSGWRPSSASPPAWGLPGEAGDLGGPAALEQGPVT